MSDDSIMAKPRWTPQEDRKVVAHWRWFNLPDGRAFGVTAKDDDILDMVQSLPFDYIELGDMAADLETDLRTSTRIIGAMTNDNLIREQRENLDPETVQTVVPILAADLETAINLIHRLSNALGVQPGGDIWDEIKRLSDKYNMTYRPGPVFAPVQSEQEDPFDYHLKSYDSDTGREILSAKYDHDTGKFILTEAPAPALSGESDLAVTQEELDAPHDESERAWINGDDDVR